MKVFNKNVPIFGGLMQIILTDNYDEVERKYHLRPLDGCCDGISFIHKTEKRKRIYCMAFEKSVSIDTIAHESLHIVNHILKDIHYEIHLENDEIQAYLLSWVVEEVVKILRKSKFKIK